MNRCNLKFKGKYQCNVCENDVYLKKQIRFQPTFERVHFPKQTMNFISPKTKTRGIRIKYKANNQ